MLAARPRLCYAFGVISDMGVVSARWPARSSKSVARR